MQVDQSQTQIVEPEEPPEEQQFQMQAPVAQVRLRRPSERIMKNKLARKIHGQGSTQETALDVDDA